MDKLKRAKLEAAGWKVGTTKEFLGLTDDEAAFVDFKVALGEALRMQRTELELSQTELAERLQSSQSRVAKMEAADATVSIDLLIRALFKLGVQPAEIARALTRRRRAGARRRPL